MRHDLSQISERIIEKVELHIDLVLLGKDLTHWFSWHDLHSKVWGHFFFNFDKLGWPNWSCKSLGLRDANHDTCGLDRK